MGSGARLRSSNEAFGRSRTGAFLLSAPVPAQPIICQVPGAVQDLFRQVNPSGEATTDVNCVCGNYPTGQPFFRELRITPSMRWLGWETPPYPPFSVTGNTSGAVLTVPLHCAVQGCQPEGPIQWQRYAITLGFTGADFGVVVPVDTVFGYWDAGGPAPPFLDGEQCTFDIDYSSTDPDVLPDPGPFNIVSIAEDTNFTPDVMIVTLDTPVTYYTAPIVEIAGTNSAYDGRWEAERETTPSTELRIIVPNYGPVGAGGTLTRIFYGPWECWQNDLSPISPKPEIPEAATPQVLTIGEFNFNFGYDAGGYGSLIPTAWESEIIAEVSAYQFSDVLTVRTESNAPLYGTDGIYVSFEGIFGRFPFSSVVAGQGTYERTDSALTDFFVNNLGNSLKIGISQLV